MPDLRCPGGLRPGQLSLLVLRHVIMGDIAVTIIDLAQRGILAVEERDDGWRVRVVPGSASGAKTELLGYERELLAALPMPADGDSVPSLPDLAAKVGARLDHVRDEIEKEAVHQGWVHHFQHSELTDSGHELVAKLGHFGRELRQLKGEDGEQALTGDLLPYALHFHLADRDQVPLARFAAAWVAAFGDLPGWKSPDHKHGEYGDESWVEAKPDPTLAPGEAWLR